MPNIYVVSMGMGVKEHLTFKACEVLAPVDIVYVMAQEKSWMVTFAQDLAPQATLRRYFPKHWAEGMNANKAYDAAGLVRDALLTFSPSATRLYNL